eukprot:TRINITY_DN917_c0_g1_i1.p1 TRINITY_DN917_c0_g1~~TRINITY_DN917_c0_g1_i1.p1  ORF type:complete len:159 (+),score=12.86 TRINITY_DN917_c0_g1_i1:58-534(+)
MPKRALTPLEYPMGEGLSPEKPVYVPPCLRTTVTLNDLTESQATPRRSGKKLCFVVVCPACVCVGIPSPFIVLCLRRTTAPPHRQQFYRGAPTHTSQPPTGQTKPRASDKPPTDIPIQKQQNKSTLQPEGTVSIRPLQRYTVVYDKCCDPKIINVVCK